MGGRERWYDSCWAQGPQPVVRCIYRARHVTVKRVTMQSNRVQAPCGELEAHNTLTFRPIWVLRRSTVTRLSS